MLGGDIDTGKYHCFNIIARLMYINLYRYLVVIYLFYSCLISVFQKSNPKTWNKTFDNDVAPLPVFITVDISYYLRNFRIDNNTAKL